ncbi:uncharacterized protein LOC129760261 [Uranotaenia lowii]|uniref:uncharacterized protein LOC129760261 n=1 Tax=Uranotaenia lowii TaxID=190385 RepID=UPI00247863A1|nr:uncharacterized protein LOC129760261 [Uranotaenia lowii]XP_055613845.1 uncharacterized protein LOC129760261 [Uranotaenia lowii]
MENASPSPPSDFRWPSYSTFMADTEPWPSGTSNRSATTGEQLNTPTGPANVCGFEYDDGGFGGHGASEARVNLTNVFCNVASTHSITEKLANDKNNNNDKKNETKGQSFDEKYIDNGSNSNSMQQIMTPPHGGNQETVVTAGLASWESCLDEVLLSPISYINTPHHSSTGMASPGSSSGDATDHRSEELETFVDFNRTILSPNSAIVEASEEDEFGVSLHEEIEQLSSSFYCNENNLVSVCQNTGTNSQIDIASPSFLKLLQEDSITSKPQSVTTVSNDISNEQPTFNANDKATVLGARPSIADSFFSDADQEDDVDEEDVQMKILRELKQHIQEEEQQQTAVTVARARPQTALKTDESLENIKTQTQLEHNYTIKIPFDGNSSQPLLKYNTVKETSLSHLSKTSHSPQPQKPVAAKRQLFTRIRSKMANKPYKRNQQVPSLKLKIINPSEAVNITPPVGGARLFNTTQMVINTPDLTNELLDLESEVSVKEEAFDLLSYITSDADYDEVPLEPKEEQPVSPEPVEVQQPERELTSTICVPTLSDLFNPGKRKLPTITIENVEELTASSNPKRSRPNDLASTTSSIYGDNASEASASTSTQQRPPKRRGRPPKPINSGLRDPSEYQHLNEVDMRYREQRDKNNEASRKSRINRKDRELKLESEAEELNRQYKVLEGEEQQLIKECARWRRAVMRLALL